MKLNPTRYLFMTIFCFLFSFNLNAQNSNVVLLIKGKLKTEDGKPIGTTLNFVNKSGKMISAKSNVIDGTYSQALMSGEDYAVFFTDYIYVEGDINFKLNATNKYNEITKDYTLKKIEEGAEVSRFNAFEQNTSDANDNLKGTISFLKEFLNKNYKAIVTITVSVGDSYFSEREEKEEYLDKRNKTKTRTVKIPASDDARVVLDERINIIKNLLAEYKINERRFQIEEDFTVNEAKKAKKSKKSKKSDPQQELIIPETNDYNIIITVTKMMNF